tara:strand:- start:156 stop:1124 length:969 start_codon:yes stop_codon:yes gene_type:complete
MDNLSLVSVIVTTYNRKEMLYDTIKSILNQTYVNFELIIVDTYSDYNFKSYIKSFNDNRIRSFQNENNGVIGINRNYGIKKSIGEYIAFCDDDDIWLPEKLEIQLQCIKTGDYIGVGCNYIKFGNTTFFRKYTNYQNHVNNKRIIIDYNKLIKGKSVPLSSLMVKRNNILFSEDKHFICVEDWDYQIQLVKYQRKIVLIPDILLKYRILDLNKVYFEKSLNARNVIEKYRQDYIGNNYSKMMNQHYIYVSLRCIKAGRKKKALNYLQKANEYSGIRSNILKIIIDYVPFPVILYILRLYFNFTNLIIKFYSTITFSKMIIKN